MFFGKIKNKEKNNYKLYKAKTKKGYKINNK